MAKKLDLKRLANVLSKEQVETIKRICDKMEERDKLDHEIKVLAGVRKRVTGGVSKTTKPSKPAAKVTKTARAKAEKTKTAKAKVSDPELYRRRLEALAKARAARWGT